MVAHTYNPSTWEAEAVRSSQVRGQPGLRSEFKDNLNYIARIYLNKKDSKFHYLLLIMKYLNGIKFVISEFCFGLVFILQVFKEYSANVGFELRWQNFPGKYKLLKLRKQQIHSLSTM